jgi:polysaccharide export outer membrane protein
VKVAPFHFPMPRGQKLYAFKLLRGTFFCLAAIIGPESRAADTPRSDNDASDGNHLSGNYVLQPFDLIQVQIFREPDLQREVRLTQESTVALPLVGNVDLAGKTVKQAEEYLHKLYDKDYIVNPQVTIIVMDYNRREVNILGSVNSPGTVGFRPEQKMGLIEAITRAGGFNRLADRTAIKLTRILPTGKTENFTINADDLIHGKSNNPWYLQKDDIIYVPERIL